MQKTISDYLLSLGFIPNKCGYRYVFDLIYLATSGKEILPLKYVGYAEIAKKYKKPAKNNSTTYLKKVENIATI